MGNITRSAGRDRPRLLLAEDDRDLGPMLAQLLSADYDVEHARDGQSALHAAMTREFDVMVIDRGLPAIEGLDLISRIRSQGVVTPVLILTARGSLADKVEGLDAGAEDYMVKPFEIAELSARLRALTRRNYDGVDVIRVGDYRFDIGQRRVTRRGQDTIQLSGRESALLHALARRPGRVFNRSELLELAFDADDTEGVVDTYVHYLRRKLGRDVIATVHGLGYRLGDS